MKKILLVRFSSIGDIVLTTPVIRCLKQKAGVELHVLTKRAYQSVLESNPYIDKLHTIDKKVQEVLPVLKRERFDHIIDLHRNIRSAQVKRGLGVASTSFRKLNWQKWLMVRLKINRLPDQHIVDRYLDTCKPFGIEYDGQGLDHFIPEEARVDLANLGVSSPFIAFAIGAAHATKRLPLEKMQSILEQIRQKVVIVGGPGDQTVGEVLANQFPDRVANLAGTLSIQQSASVLQQAQLVISHDTGMMHIAAALRKPIVSVWGNTIPAFGMYPFYPIGVDKEFRMEVQGLSCRPCSKIGFEKCPKGHFQCMQGIDEAAIRGSGIVCIRGLKKVLS